NNTCSSSHELDAMTVSAGARCYIGTLWSIGTASATKAARIFYDEAVRGGRLLDAFVMMNTSLKGGPYADVYIYWGLHFSSLRTPSLKSDERLLKALLFDLSVWFRKINATRDAKMRRNAIGIAKFLVGVLTSMFSPARVAEIANLSADKREI